MAKKTPRPTRKQAQLVRLIAAGVKPSTAAVAAGYSNKHPAASASQALASISGRFPDLLDQLGLTDKSLIEDHLKPLLKAKRKKHFAHEGIVKSSRSYVDNDTRLAALDMTFRLKGSYAPVKTEAETKYIDRIVIDLPRPQKRTDSAIESDQIIDVEKEP